VQITLSHKIQLSPNKRQAEYFAQACGISRFTWNWALDKWKSMYAAGESPTGMGLKKVFNSIKREEYPWIMDVTKYACQQPFLNLQKAFVSFFTGKSKYPQFKKKGVHDSFYIGCDQFSVTNNKVRIPKLGNVRMTECLGFNGKIMSATVSRVADKWFISISVQMEITPGTCESQASVGVDLGIKALATLSTGETIEGPQPLKKLLAKLKRLQQSLSRKQRGSKNRAKARQQVARLHYRISCARQDSLHKLTTYLANNFSEIVIEDLNVSGMLANHKLARSISDMGFHEFKRQLLYKAELSGARVVLADRWYPSSKTCSQCGTIHTELTLANRTYTCSNCGLQIDRDLNAAINLQNYPQTVALAAA
jgi:putative transposase